MSSSFMGVSIDPTTVKDGSLKAAFDPITHPQTTGFGVTVLTGTPKAGALGIPVVTLGGIAATGGNLAPGTYTYHVHGVSALGMGNAGTLAVTVPAALSAPVQSAATVTTLDSGIFGATGTYYYKITATNAIGETTGSNEQSAVVAATTSTVTLAWAAVAGATGYKVYRGTSAGAEDHLVGTVGSGTTLSFKDTGNTGSAASVPGSNTSATSTNKITLNWGDLARETAGYKIYRGGLHLADVAANVVTYVDDGSISPSGAEPAADAAALTDVGEKEGGAAPKPVDGGETPVAGEGDGSSPTEAAL